MNAADDIFSRYAKAYESRKDTEMSLLDYLEAKFGEIYGL